MQWHLRNDHASECQAGDHPNEQRRDGEFVGIVIVSRGGGFGGGRRERHATAASRRGWFGESRRPYVHGSSRGFGVVAVVVVFFFEISSDILHHLRHGWDHGKPNHHRSEADATKVGGGK